MNCQQFDKIIVNLSCGLLDAAERHRALAHAQNCISCGTRLTRQQKTVAGLDTLAKQEQTINAPAHLAATLQAAFESQQTIAARDTVSPAPVRLWSFPVTFSLPNWRWAAAMAAVLVISGLVAMAWRRTDVHQPPSIDTTVANVTKQPPVQPSLNDAPKVAVKIPPKAKRTKPVRREAEEFGALISLMPFAQTETEEFQQIVRMQIPRSTLQLWGLPLNEESNSRQVNAEVYFSENGVARAIRLHN